VADTPVAPEQPVAVVNEAGQVGTLPYSAALKAFGKRGVRPATADEFAAGKATAREEQKKADFNSTFGGEFGGGVASAALGAVDQATFGLAPYAARKLAGAVAGPEGQEIVTEGMRTARAANPTASMVGEGVGLVGPALLSGGTSAVVKGATALPRGISAIAGVAERAATGAIGTGAESLAIRAAQAGARLAVRGGIEGTAYGAGRAVSEAAFENKDATAEKIIAGGLEGGMIGAGAGGVLGAGGVVVGAGLKGAANSVKTAIGGSGKSLGATLENWRDKKVWKAIGGNTKKAESAAERVEGGFATVATNVREGLVSSTGKSLERLSPKEAAKAIEELRATSGAAVGKIRDELDVLANKTGIRPELTGFASKLDEHLTGLYQVGNGAAPQLESYFNGMVARAGARPTFAQMNMELKQLSKLSKYDASVSNDLREGYRSMRSFLSEELDEVAGKAAEATGVRGFAEQYQAARKLNQSYIIADDAISELVAKEGRASSFGFRDAMSAATGAGVGGIPGAIGATVFNKVMRERGDFVMAGALGKLAKLAQIESAEKAFDAKLKSGVADFFADKVSRVSKPGLADALKPGKGESSRDATVRVMNEVASASSNPSAVANVVASRIDGIAEHAPELSSAISTHTAKANDFLASKLPANMHDSGSLTPHLDKPRISESDAAKFNRYLTAVKNPMTVVDDLRSGRLTREGVEAVKTVYPNIYTDMRNQVIEQLSTAKQAPAYYKRIQLGILFDLPTDASMKPTFIKTINEMYVKQSAATQQKQSGGQTSNAGENSSIKQSQTSSQLLEGLQR